MFMLIFGWLQVAHFQEPNALLDYYLYVQIF
jgi:hypothetical protein